VIRARVLAALLAGASLVPTAVRAADAVPPKATDISYYYDLFDQSFVRPLTRVLDPSLWVRKATANPREAMNIDEQDAVRLPSTWWQPRAGFRAVGVQQMLRGTGPGGPLPGRWTVSRAKTQGVTPGFFIKDPAGTRFIIKFDPPACPEMATGADVVSSYLFWAAGYNVPCNTVVQFRAESLLVASDAVVTDARGRKTPMTQEFLTHLLSRVRREADGSYRAVASRLLAGKPLGPFEYNGRRKDDPEDQVPHQHRRELRGLWTMCAWLGHADSRGPNSLDMWVTDGGRSFVRHHLIDFGSCLGSGAVTKRSFQTGHEYFVDYGTMTRSALTLGLVPAKWEASEDPELPAVGFIDSKTFDPQGWRPDYPNPAFDERTARDIRWGVRIVGAMSDSLIRAAVEQGRFTDPRATDYLTRVLIERRDKILRAWPAGGSPVSERQP